MKEIKDFFEEIEKLEIAQGVIDINEAKRLVSEAYVAGTQVPAGTPSITSNPEAICTIGGEVVKAFEFEYKGHSYIWFHRRGGWDGIVHNPDCRCNKK